MLSSTLTDHKFYWHLSFWFHAQQSPSTCRLNPWNWAASYDAHLLVSGSDRQSLCSIRHAIVQGHQLMLHLVTEWYFAHLQPVAPREDSADRRLWTGAIATNWQNLLADVETQRLQYHQTLYREHRDSAQRHLTRLAPSARAYYRAQSLPTPRCIVYGMVLCPEEDWLILGGSDRILKILLTFEKRTLTDLSGHGGDVLSLAVQRSRHVLASSSSEGVVQVWNLKNLQPIHRFIHSGEPIRSLSFDCDGRFLVGASLGQGLWVWDMWQGSTFRQWHCPTAGAVAFHRNQQSLWVALRDGGLQRFTIASEEQSRPIDTPALRSLLLSPDGTTLAGYDRHGRAICSTATPEPSATNFLPPAGG